MANAGSHRFSRRGLIRAGGASAAGLTALGATGCSPFGDSSTSSSGGGTADRMNVLLIVTDSTRRDFVSAYAGADTLARTPNIDALAREGLRFDHAVPEAMPTVPVRRALLTGVRSYPFRDWQATEQLPPFPGWNPIPESRRVFPEMMRDAGVETAYVTDNPFLIGPRFADFRSTLDISKPIYLQGEYRVWNQLLGKDELASDRQIARYLLPGLKDTEAERRLREHEFVNQGLDPDQLSGARVARSGIAMLDTLKDRQPFFLGVDAFDPHEAFDPPEAYKRRFGAAAGIEPILPFTTPFARIDEIDVTDAQVERVRELYAAELTWMDAWLGRLLNKLDDLGLAERTVVHYMSDHGIVLGEKGILGKANSSLGSEVHRIPYMIRHPEGRRAGESTGYFASTHDVAPTLLSLQGIASPGAMDGEDLSVLFDGKEPPARDIWTTAYADFVAAGDGRYVLIADNQGKSRQLYDRRTDPAEENDVAQGNRDVVDRLWGAVVAQAGGTMPVFSKTGVVSG
ncbi:MAG: sulfatase [Solirubrobacteraceae bacterium]|jgi:arylsulfatase A-like enzyme